MLGANEMLLRSLHRNALLAVGLRRLRGGAQSLMSSNLVSGTLHRHATSQATSRASTLSGLSSSSSSQIHPQFPRAARSSSGSGSSKSSHTLSTRTRTHSIGTTALSAKTMAPSPLPLRDPLADITAQPSVATKAASGSATALTTADDARRVIGSLGGEKRRFLKTEAAATGGTSSGASLLKGNGISQNSPSVDAICSPSSKSPLRKKATVSGTKNGASTSSGAEEDNEDGASWDTKDSGVWQPGGIHIILGPMFSGKTTALLHQMSAAKADGKEVLLVKSAVDTRYAVNEVVAHSGDRMQCLAIASLTDIPLLLGQEAYEKVDVIGVDEAQFIQDVEFFATKAADEHGKTIILAGLDSDFMRRRFGSLVDLVPMADSVVKLTARCQVCGQDAIFTLRKTRDMRTELVGGADVYMPVCRKHYLGAKSLVGSLPDVPQEEDSSITAK